MDLPRKKRHQGLSQVLILMGLGAGLMYLFDPQNGNRRRALLRNKVVALRNDAERLAGGRSEDLRNRAQGLAAQVVSRVAPAKVDDPVLAARVKSSIGRNVTPNPSAIEVAVNNGVVTLSGPLLADEVQKLVRHVRSIPGVRDVVNNLDVHQEPANIPGLQTGDTGGSRTTTKRSSTTTRRTSERKKSIE